MPREICSNCERPISVCFCNEIKVFSNQVKLIILQHPDETKHPLGTAKMAQLSFKNSHLFIGEEFNSNKELNKLLKINNGPSAILYPHKDAIEISQFDTKTNPQDQVEEIQNLIVLDGTWRKAKRIFEKTDFLKELKFLSLNIKTDQKYKIRKAPKAGLLSTLEASAMALSVLDRSDYSDSTDVLEKQVAKHIKHMGQLYEKNYQQDK